MSAVAVIIAAIVIIGFCALVVYVGSLARSAYKLKIDLQRDLDAGLARIKEEVDAITRNARRELGVEIDRSRAGFQSDIQSRFDQFSGAINRRLASQEEAAQNERAQTAKVLAAFRAKLQNHDDLLAKAKGKADNAKNASVAVAEVPPDAITDEVATQIPAA